MILANTTGTFTDPVDATQESADTDLSDGSACVYISHGTEAHSFTNLSEETQYYFKAWAYSNSGSNIDYKLDGTIPATDATTGAAPLILTIGEGTETPANYPFKNSYDNGKTQMLFTTADLETEKTLTTLSMNFSAVSEADFRDFDNFSIKMKHTSTTSFSAAYEDITGATEVFSDADYNIPGATGWHEWDITDFEYNGTDNLIIEITWGDNAEFTFTEYAVYATDYSGGGNNLVTYGYDDDETPPDIDGQSDIRPNIEFAYSVETVDPEPTNHVTEFAAAADGGFAIDLSWTKNDGAQVPAGYLVKASTNDNITDPVDGTEVADNSTIGDYSGAINIAYSNENHNWTGLTPGQTYYFKIFPYTNTGAEIDYKTTDVPYTSITTEYFTEQTGISLTGVFGGNVAWGDYNNDGDLDILLTGHASSDYVSEIYKNNRDDSFTVQSEIDLTGVYAGSVAWGDYDNDGDLDILLTGTKNSSEVISYIYRNNGDNTFTWQSEISLLGLHSGNANWGDYNNDGYLDILLSGNPIKFRDVQTKIYKNNGDNTFSLQTEIDIPGIKFIEAHWADYNNDGFLDFLLSGSEVFSSVFNIYINNGDETFTKQDETGISSIIIPNIDVGDYNNDGDLDILLTGTGASWIPVSKIYKNNSTTANTPPQAPTNLQASVNGQEVTQSWDKATDEETPQNGLTYNLYVENAIKPGMADNGNGFRRVVEMGNMNHVNSYTLKNLPVGSYTWSVQAIDHSFAGSEFASAGNFSITNPVVANPANDLASGAKALDYPVPAFVDIDNNETFDAFTGMKDGTIKYYLNEGSTSSPSWSEQTGGDNPFNTVDVGMNAAPTFVDIDNDNDFDAFIGDSLGTISFYENTGTTESPTFTEQTGANNPFDGEDVGFFAVPSFADLDDDGDFDAVIGDSLGRISYFKNTGTQASAVFEEQDGPFNPFYFIEISNLTSIDFADLNVDGDYDLVVGTDTGTVVYVENFGNNENPDFQEQSPYGNPFNGIDVGDNAAPAMVDIDGDSDMDIYIGDRNGSVVCYENQTPFEPRGLLTDVVSGILSTEASGGGDVTTDGGSDITSKGLCWATAENPTLSDNHIVGGNGTGTFTADLTELEANTLYYVRSFAINAFGTSYGPQESFTTADLIDYAWNGTDNSWSTVANWLPNGAPTTNDNVRIPAGTQDLIIDAEVNVNDLVIEAGGKLTIPAGQGLDVRGTFTIESDETGIGSFIHNGTFTKDLIRVEKYLAKDRWWYMSAPMPSTAFDFDILRENSNLYFWEETDTAANTDHGWNQVTNESYELDVSRGYAVKYDRDTSLVFAGSFLYNGGGTVDFTRTTGLDYDGFNLAGNPYTSTMDWDAASGWTKTNIESNSIWYRSNGQFPTYNGNLHTGTLGGSQFIPPMQAFWIRVANGFDTGSLMFDNDVRTHLLGDSSFFKNPGHEMLRLHISRGEYYDEMLVCLTDEASREFDIFDTEKMFAQDENHPQIYSKTDEDHKLVINSLPLSEASHSVQLYLTANEAGIFTFSASEMESFPDGTEVYLEDKHYNKLVNLIENPEYEFNSNEIENSERFVLHITKAGVNSLSTLSAAETSIFSYESDVYIRGNESLKNRTLYIYDLIGNEILIKTLPSNEMVKIIPGVHSGHYFIKLVCENKVISKKVYIH